MTFLAWRRQTRVVEPPVSHPARLTPDSAPRIGETSIVVPVRNNASGIARLMEWWKALPSPQRCREFIVVDDGSSDPVSVGGTDGVRLIRNPLGRGPAAARNIGWRAASGKWVAFTDSDCVPSASWPGTFQSGWDGEVAVQGDVRALGSDIVSGFYEAQQVLRPMAWTADGRPRYLISANALVQREALERVGGFSERFRLAAGEDVDLGLRLAEIGRLRWNSDATVAHDFEPDLRSFVRRFVRYGRGNRVLVNAGRKELERDFAPRPFLARSINPIHQVLGGAAFVSLLAGWLVEAAAGGDSSGP